MRIARTHTHVVTVLHTLRVYCDQQNTHKELSYHLDTTVFTSLFLHGFQRLSLTLSCSCMTVQFSEAVSAYLSASPPRAEDAVKAARLLGDWQLAIMIAGRYGNSNRGQGGPTANTDAETAAGVNNADLDPKRVAFEIVSAFKESLEQGESGIFEDAADADLNPLGIGEEEEGKALEAAQMSVSYCDDAETAVSILLLASKWTAAAQLALKVNRRDLFFDEVCLYRFRECWRFMMMKSVLSVFHKVQFCSVPCFTMATRLFCLNFLSQSGDILSCYHLLVLWRCINLCCVFMCYRLLQPSDPLLPI